MVLREKQHQDDGHHRMLSFLIGRFGYNGTTDFVRLIDESRFLQVFLSN